MQRGIRKYASKFVRRLRPQDFEALQRVPQERHQIHTLRMQKHRQKIADGFKAQAVEYEGMASVHEAEAK